MKEDGDFAGEQEIVGGAFIGRGVVGLCLDLAEYEMRRVKAAEPLDAREQIVGDAVHDLLDLAMHIGVQPAEIGDAGGGAHAAEKSIALDQQDAAAMLSGGCRRRDPGRSATQHHHLIIAHHGGLPRRLGQGGRD